jgi:hypothetical protein
MFASPKTESQVKIRRDELHTTIAFSQLSLSRPCSPAASPGKGGVAWDILGHLYHRAVPLRGRRVERCIRRRRKAHLVWSEVSTKWRGTPPGAVGHYGAFFPIEPYGFAGGETNAASAAGGKLILSSPRSPRSGGVLQVREYEIKWDIDPQCSRKKAPSGRLLVNSGDCPAMQGHVNGDMSTGDAYAFHPTR